MGRYGEIWGEMGRDGERWGEMGRDGERWGEMGRACAAWPPPRRQRGGAALESSRRRRRGRPHAHPGSHQGWQDEAGEGGGRRRREKEEGEGGGRRRREKEAGEGGGRRRREKEEGEGGGRRRRAEGEEDLVPSHRAQPLRLVGRGAAANVLDTDHAPEGRRGRPEQKGVRTGGSGGRVRERPARTISRPISEHLVRSRNISSDLGRSRPIRPISSDLGRSRNISADLGTSRPISEHLVRSRNISADLVRSDLPSTTSLVASACVLTSGGAR